MKTNASPTPQTTHRSGVSTPRHYSREANETVTACNAMKPPEAAPRQRLKKKED
jgi:hypothetical protein